MRVLEWEQRADDPSASEGEGAVAEDCPTEELGRAVASTAAGHLGTVAAILRTAASSDFRSGQRFTLSDKMQALH